MAGKETEKGKNAAVKAPEKTKAIEANKAEKAGAVVKKEVKKIEAKPTDNIDKKAAAKAYDVLNYPLITEKAVNLIETENKLVFIVNGKSRKADVKKAIEELFNVKVDKVNILKDMKNRKRAFVKINEKYKADDIATRLGVL